MVPQTLTIENVGKNHVLALKTCRFTLGPKTLINENVGKFQTSAKKNTVLT